MMPKGDYTAHADAIASEIAAGRLKVGDRLPPQRAFAYKKRIAVSTAGRVYSELLRRGLVVGEVGRGTFVAGGSAHVIAQGVPHDGPIDLEFNFPTHPELAGIVAQALIAMQRGDVVADAMAPVTQRRIDIARRAFASGLATPQWQPDADALVFTGSGRQSIAAALSALVPVGGRIAVEALSYPMIKGIAARIGAAIVPVAMDAEGLVPEALARAHRKATISAVYVQPVMHNPLGISMGPDRRAEIVRAAAKLGIIIVEDLVYGFLADTPPLTALDPDRCIVVDSLSKRIAPGISVGLLHVPSRLRDRVWSTVRGGAWTVPPMALSVAVRLLQDGAVAEIVKLKRQDARRRQAIMAELLAPHVIKADPNSYHLWLELPGGWRSEAFAAAAARAGVAVTPSSAFAMAVGHAPPAVRLALGLPSHDVLRLAGSRLAAILRRPPGDDDVTE